MVVRHLRLDCFCFPKDCKSIPGERIVLSPCYRIQSDSDIRSAFCSVSNGEGSLPKRGVFEAKNKLFLPPSATSGMLLITQD
jgi:hypothetical protein